MLRVLPLLLLLAVPAFAQDEPVVLLDQSVCAHAADYKPGVDVRGRAVMSADLPDADYGAELSDSVAVTLKLDLAEKLGIPTWMLTSEAQIGTLTREQDGRLLLNGKPLGKPSQADLVALCRHNQAR